MLVGSALTLLAVFGFYLILGSLLDLARWRSRRLTARATTLLGSALYDQHSDVGATIEVLHQIPTRVLLSVALRLSLDLDNQVHTRLVNIVATTGLTRRIRRLSRSRRWRRRQRAARLAHLLETKSDVRTRLLCDKHPRVRVSAIETLAAEHTLEHVELLLSMLDDDDFAVEYVAEEALLRGDGRIIENLIEHLDNARGKGALHTLEVAATFRDPRLFDAIHQFSNSDDPRARRLVAHGLSAGSVTRGLPVLMRLLEDGDPRVRIAALEGVARLRVEELSARVGSLLADQSWEVRRHSGLALEGLGAAGVVVLRTALDSPDRFARDMARQVLDSLEASGRVAHVPERSELEHLDHWYPTGVAA